MNGYLTTKEAAEYLRYDEETVRRLARKNIIKSLRAGTRYRFRREDLENYLTNTSVAIRVANHQGNWKSFQKRS